jgi:hypothetical protein
MSARAGLFLISLIICIGSLSAVLAENKNEDSVTEKITQKTEQENEQENKTANDDSYKDLDGVSFVTGFYTGADIGLDIHKTKAKKQTTTATTDRNKTKGGFLLNLFGGYSYQFGKLIIGVDGTASFTLGANKSNFDSETLTTKKRYGFGLAPKIGYNIRNNINGYLSLGMMCTKYKASTTSAKKSLHRCAVFVGLGLEKVLGQMFVRGEVDRVFKKSVAKVADVSVNSASYIFKFGGGYRF